MIAGLKKEDQDEVVEELKDIDHVTESTIKEKISQFSKNDRKNELPSKDFMNFPEDDIDNEEDEEMLEQEEAEEEAADEMLDDEMVNDLNEIVQHIVDCPFYWVNDKKKKEWKKIMKEIWTFLEV